MARSSGEERLQPTGRSEAPAALTALAIEGAVELMGRAGRPAAVRVQGASMRPTLEPGGWIRVDFAPTRLRFGDLVVLRSDGYLVVHRLVSLAGRRQEGKRFRTRGDGRLELDPPVARSRIVGRVTGLLRRGGWRSLEGARPRFYAAWIALHDRGWAAAGSTAARLDRSMARIGLPSRLRAWVGRADRLLLRLTDRLFFEALNPALRPLESPGEPDPGHPLEPRAGNR